MALELDAAGRPRARLVTVGADDEPPRREPDAVVVGCGLVSDQVAAACDLILTGGTGAAPPRRVEVVVPSLEMALAAIDGKLAKSPRAALTLCTLLRPAAVLSVADGLAVESAAYSMLLAAPEFARWRAEHSRRAPARTARTVVPLVRSGDELVITLDRPERRNAFDNAMRDGLIAALDLLELDTSIRRAVIRAKGPDFCSGGDFDEFGSIADVATAHIIRLDRSVAARIDRCRSRLTVEVHGACIGAGIEFPSFAGRVRARADTCVRLPEIGMGLIPGAGGTVGITRRIGRWRTAYLALTGASISAPVALSWGLVDEIVGDDT